MKVAVERDRCDMQGVACGVGAFELLTRPGRRDGHVQVKALFRQQLKLALIGADHKRFRDHEHTHGKSIMAPVTR